MLARLLQRWFGIFTAVAMILGIVAQTAPAAAQTRQTPAPMAGGVDTTEPSYPWMLATPPPRTTNPLFASATTNAPGLDRLGRQFDNSLWKETQRPGPNVPEPMVFDLIRPLGVRRGELEVNVLGLLPLRRTLSPFESSPEVEYGVFDNFALEFELPMAEGRVEAFKPAFQYTLGTGFNDQFNHGIQGIMLVDRTNGAITPTLLYLAAARFNQTYSLMTMFGFSHKFGGNNQLNPTQLLVNTAILAEVNKRWTFGLEANYVSKLRTLGETSLLLMPQAHWNVIDNVSIQFGVGTHAQYGKLTGEAAFRIVRSL